MPGELKIEYESCGRTTRAPLTDRDGATVVLQFGAPSIKKAKVTERAPPSVKMELEDVSLDSEGILRVRGGVVSSEPLAAVRIYVGGTLLGTGTLSQARHSVNFQFEGPFKQTDGEHVIKIVCTDRQGSQTSESRTVVLARQVPTSSPKTRVLFGAILAEFDAEYYAHEYPDLHLKIEKSQLVSHFLECGWYEGRNPNAFFDTVSYMFNNQDVLRSRINPFVHYLSQGRREGRKITPSISPSIRTNLLFGYELADWVRPLRTIVDLDFHRRQIAEPCPDAVDLVAHFAYRGWREGMCPNANFSVREWMERYPGCTRYLVNPVLIQLENERGSFDLNTLLPSTETGFDPRHPEAIGATTADIETKESVEHRSQIDIVRSEFSTEYYLATYPDIAQAGVDPLDHFFYTGWREGRNPNQDFDTKYYLEVNEDIRIATLNPFWHYIVSGSVEGRLPRRPGGYRRDIIDAALPPSRRTYDSCADLHERSLTSDEFIRATRTSFGTKLGLVISLSHDCYVRQIGGTQIFIADEQRRFNKLGQAYLHISPQIARLSLVDKESDVLIRVVVDGRLIGVTSFSSVCELVKLYRQNNLPTMLIVHCILGFKIQDVIDLHSHLRPDRSIYWLHDYSSLCAGFNLLRNNVQFCGAPPPQSQACTICVYGKSRTAHLAEMHQLFSACQFEVASPSAYALGLWQKSTSLPRKSDLVHPHWKLVRKNKKNETHQRRASAISIGFVGFAASHKGWPIFQEIVRRFSSDKRYRFYHFATRDTPTLPGIEFVTTEVTPEDRYATTRLLKQHHIDLLLLLSPWPETFSFVAHEAIGAAVRIVCLGDGGNVVDLVRLLGYGKVFPEVDDVIEFLASDAASAYLTEIAHETAQYTIDEVGTSATIEGVAMELERVK
jgi:hypothetical protein